MAKSKIKKGFQVHHISIFSSIDEELAKAFSTLEEIIWSGLKGEDYSPLIVTLNSRGGDIYTSSAFCKLLEVASKQREVWTSINGDCSSAAIDIFLKGSKRFAHGHCCMTFHQAYTRAGKGATWQKHDHVASIRTLEYQDKTLEEQFKMLKIPRKLQDDVRAGQDVTLEGEDLYKYKLATHKGTVWEYIGRNYADKTTRRRRSGT